MASATFDTDQLSNRSPLASVATGRTTALFTQDLGLCRDQIEGVVTGKRVLCVGAAGSIGSSTIALIVHFAPQTLHVIDQNENEITEVARRFHAQAWSRRVKDFRALPLDYGSQAMRLFLHSQVPYDLVLNFAAIKHVRSEKDAFSILQMFDTNLLKQARFLRWLDDLDFSGRYFSVSTDKAANPTSMMGATKRVMEHVIFSAETAASKATAVSTARFANVAFSNGSLLQSFEQRFSRREPLAAPVDTRRYFVSLEESGQICLIAACAAPHGTIVIPRLDPRDNLVLLQGVAEQFLAINQFLPAFYVDAELARANFAHDVANGRWPLVLTPLDTSGEKSYEEFIGSGEQSIEIGLPNLLAVPHRPAPAGSVQALVEEIAEYLEPAHGEKLPRSVDKDALKSMIAKLEPRFLGTHRETGRNLDDRL
jgi:FlaA1/EpsC-like NDP-sugar epimerase